MKQSYILKGIIFILFQFSSIIFANAGKLVVGDYGGKAEVSANGAATYTLPIECPKGVNGMEPKVNLTYNSNFGDGPIGYGWGLSSGSIITKTSATPFYDNKLLPYNNDLNGDYLMLDGQRLIKYAEIGNDSTEFRTESDNYNRIIRIGKLGNFTFVVFSTSGRKLTYSQLNEGKDWYKGNLGWYLVEEEDMFGNYITYNYDVVSVGEREYNIKRVCLSDIYYGGNKNNNSNHVCRINFAYNYHSNNTTDYFIAGFEKLGNHKKLSTITTYSNDVVNRRYELKYEVKNNKDQLISVTAYGNNNDYLKSLDINWNETDITTKEESQTITHLDDFEEYKNTTGVPTEVIYGDKKWLVADYNADGLLDIIAFSKQMIVETYCSVTVETYWDGENFQVVPVVKCKPV